MPSSQEAVVLKKAITKFFGSPAGKTAVQSVISNAKVAMSSPSKNVMKAPAYTESSRMGASSIGVLLSAPAGAAFSPKQTTIRMASSVSDPM